jgi:hypothetical protein
VNEHSDEGSVTDLAAKRGAVLDRPAAPATDDRTDEARARFLLKRALDGERVSGASVIPGTVSQPESPAAPAPLPRPRALPKQLQPDLVEEESAEPAVDEVDDLDGDDGPEHGDRLARLVGPRAAEDFRAVFERLTPRFEPSDDAALHRRRLRRLRARRYLIPLAIGVIPVPPFLPWIGPKLHGFSLAGTYSCVPLSLQVNIGFDTGTAAVVGLMPAAYLMVRCGRHFRARTKPGFTLRVATLVVLVGGLEYQPAYTAVLHFLNGGAP